MNQFSFHKLILDPKLWLIFSTSLISCPLSHFYLCFEWYQYKSTMTSVLGLANDLPLLNTVKNPNWQEADQLAVNN